ncbi:DUF4405 domain-containing protein [Pseudomonas syringae]|uniref:DUF4405 domain-containing protein n=1 Tax=Pseudomonas syringae TaxID=317 RepID=UPI001F3C8C64|nr:DUF4405 domain-containing protein [Pseudomonas syringae]
MKLALIKHLALPLAMATLLLCSLAYWWLDNLAHEIFGTVLFSLIGCHVVRNRNGLIGMFSASNGLSGAVSLVLHLLIIVAVVALLATSVLISKSVFTLFTFRDNFYIRDIHWFVAYWVVILVGTHVGVHWARVMAMLGLVFKLNYQSTLRTIVLRIAAVLMAEYGIWSLSVLGTWTKLTFNHSLDFWDFTVAVAPFFAHWVAVLCLAATTAHYVMVVARVVVRRNALRTKTVSPGNGKTSVNPQITGFRER